MHPGLQLSERPDDHYGSVLDGGQPRFGLDSSAVSAKTTRLLLERALRGCRDAPG